MGFKTTIAGLFFEADRPEKKDPVLNELTIKYDPEGGNKKPAESVGFSKEMAFVLAIYLYFSGWVYVYAYFQFFGLSAGQSGIEIYSYLIYSYNVLKFMVQYGGFFLWLGLAILLAISIVRLTARKQLKKGLIRSVNLLALVVLFPVLFYYAQKAGGINARYNAYGRNSTLPVIEIHFKKEAVSYAARADSLEFTLLSHLSDDGVLRVVSSTDAELYILLFTGNPQDALTIYRIKKDNLLYEKAYTLPPKDL